MPYSPAGSWVPHRGDDEGGGGRVDAQGTPAVRRRLRRQPARRRRGDGGGERGRAPRRPRSRSPGCTPRASDSGCRSSRFPAPGAPSGSTRTSARSTCSWAPTSSSRLDAAAAPRRGRPQPQPGPRLDLLGSRVAQAAAGLAWRRQSRPARGAPMFEQLVAAAPQGMVDDLFHLPMPPAEKVIRTIAVYLGILIVIRVAGKRLMAPDELAGPRRRAAAVQRRPERHHRQGQHPHRWPDGRGRPGRWSTPGSTAGPWAARGWPGCSTAGPPRWSTDGISTTRALTRLGMTPEELNNAIQAQGADSLSQVSASPSSRAARSRSSSGRRQDRHHRRPAPRRRRPHRAPRGAGRSRCPSEHVVHGGQLHARGQA